MFGKQSRVLAFIVLLFIVAPTSSAQKGFNIQVFLAPGASIGGRYDVYKNDLQSVHDTGWNKLGKSLTFGIETGAGFGYNFTDQAGVLIGVLYAKSGQIYNTYEEISPSMQRTTFDRKVELNYVRFPVQFSYTVHPDKPVTFIGMAGFYFGILTGYEDSDNYDYSNKPARSFIAKGNSYTYTNGEKETSTGFIDGIPYEETDYGGIIGLGLQIRLSKLFSMPLMLRYQYGFKDIKNTASQYKWPGAESETYFWKQIRDDNPNATLPYHNSSLEISIGLRVSFR